MKNVEIENYQKKNDYRELIKSCNQQLKLVSQALSSVNPREVMLNDEMSSIGFALTYIYSAIKCLNKV